MDEVIYHYTSLEVLKKIIEGSDEAFFNMRATHIKYLNDSSEFVLAIKLLQSRLIEFDISLGKNSQNFSKFLNEKRMKFFEYEDIDDDFPYVISFSENHDNLSMWNLYANNSKGVAIGLKAGVLKNLAGGYKIEKCLYDSIEFENYLDKNILEIHSVIKINDFSIGAWLNYDSDLLSDFYKFLPILKDKNFAYENEKRLIIKTKHEDSIKDKYHISGNILKPYKEIKIPLNAFSEIILGPLASLDSLKMPLARLFRAKGLKMSLDKEDGKIYLKKSECPFRIL